MDPFTVMAIISAISVGTSIYQGQQAAEAQEEASEISSAQQKSADIAAKRSKLREERIKRAQIAQASETLGVTGSSTESGALGSLGTQTGAAFSSLSGSSLAVDGINKANQRSFNAQSNAQLASGIGNISMSAFNSYGGFKKLFEA